MQKVAIRVKGHLDPEWSEWLNGLTITHPKPHETLLAGFVTDQAALYGLLSKLRDLGLALISVSCKGENKTQSCLTTPLQEV